MSTPRAGPIMAGMLYGFHVIQDGIGLDVGQPTITDV